MLLILRCALVIGAIYALSPLRDPLPVAPPTTGEGLAGAEALARTWSALPEETRRALAAEATRQALARARAAVGDPDRPSAP